jgi:hypothetical protein
MKTLLHKRKRLLISFSGGKTSAYMAKEILKDWDGIWSMWDEVVVIFANTGAEHDKTLEYVHACDQAYKFKTVWVEAVFHPTKGVGTTHRIVDFVTASRRGKPFEDMIQKHGLPNTQFPHCTRETKLNPIKSYLRSIGWAPSTYNTAIGIRFDEYDRMSPPSMEGGAFYPLVDWRVRKEDVLAWEEKQPVRLGIPEHYGNCVWCWKKSDRKLATVAREMPEAFDFPRHLETTYRDAGAGFGDRRLFRGRKTTDDIFALARDPLFEPFVDGVKNTKWDPQQELDFGQACGESCEIGVDGAHDEGI